MNYRQQVKFYYGDIAAYNNYVAGFSGGLFFDSANKEIWLEGYNYSRKPVIAGEGAIGVDVYDPSTKDASIYLNIDNFGNDNIWITQSGNGIRFNEELLKSFKINNKGILSGPWLTGSDVSVGDTPVPADTTIVASDTLAMALQKLKRYAEDTKIYAVKWIDIIDESDSTKFTVNDSSIKETIAIKEGNYISIDKPVGIDNKIVISSTLSAGDNISISAQGTISTEGFYWNEID